MTTQQTLSSVEEPPGADPAERDALREPCPALAAAPRTPGDGRQVNEAAYRILDEFLNNGALISSPSRRPKGKKEETTR